MLREGLRVLLSSRAGIKVVGEADTCRQAVEGVHDLQPDLVLLDFKLPDGDGLSIVPALRRAAPATKIVLVCGSTTRPLVRASLQAGVDGFVGKEGDVREIVDAIHIVSQGGTYLSPRVVSLLAEKFRQGDSRVFGPLSGQEVTVLRGIAAGLSYKEIALQMGVGLKTVETYKARLASKTGLRTKVALARFAVENDLTSL